MCEEERKLDGLKRKGSRKHRLQFTHGECVTFNIHGN